MSPEPIEVRSFRSVFDLERRIYRIDRIRLNPAGVPVRGVVYFLALASCAAAVAALPLVGLPLRSLPWLARDLALPAAAAALLTVVRIEGRPFHVAAGALIHFAVTPRRLSGFRPCAPPGSCWHPPEVVFVPDGSDARPRRLLFTGPGVVLCAAAHERVEWGAGPIDRLTRRPAVTLRELPRRAPRRAAVIELSRAARLEVRPAPRAARERRP